MTRALPRPFLKWAGGKTQLLDALEAHLPASFGAYFEPFAGSAALFFALHRRGALRDVFLSDSNAELMDAYRAVRDHVEAVIALLSRYPYDRETYYALRSHDPARLDPAERAARTIYLNKAGYNGLYRVNRRGEFNVPFGRHRSPAICDAGNLRAVASALQQVRLEAAPYAIAVEEAAAGDLVYFDPPYAPLSRTAHFTAYGAGGFGTGDQRRLRDTCLALAGRGVYVMESNSDTPLIRDLYGAPPFEIHEVQASRAINSRAERRGPIGELIITGYPSAVR